MMFSCSVASELSNSNSCQSVHFCVLIQLSFCFFARPCKVWLNASGVGVSFVWRKRYVLLCITNTIPSCNVYIPEYMSHISALYIQFNRNYHRKTLPGLSMLQKFTRNWPVILCPPVDVYIYIWCTVHNCIIQLSKVCEHYSLLKFVKFCGLKIWLLYFYGEIYIL